jgi:putative oligomerization/nucleic acid binding protein/SmpA/OmlA family protein
MKNKFLALSLFIAALLAGCATADRLNNVRIGMSEDQVVAVMGKPDSRSAQRNIEYLTYYLNNESRAGDQPYSVRLVDGKVESFGRFAQLFDIYNRPPTGVGPQSPSYGMPTANVDLAGQLQRLKVMKDQGTLTPEEFEKAKANLLGLQH